MVLYIGKGEKIKNNIAKRNELNMKKSKKINSEEQVTDVKGTIVGFVAPDPVEQTQEEEIQKFQLKKQNEKELAQLSEEEQKKKRKKYEEDEQKLEGVKAELLKSIRERIPAIEKRFKLVIAPTKKGKVVEKVQGKTLQNIEAKDADLSKTQIQDEKERE